MRFTALILASLALAGCGAPSPTTGGKPAAAAPDIQWGEAVNGLQAGLALKSPPAGPESQATLLLAVRNVGTKPVKIMKVAKIGLGSLALALEVKSEGKTCSWLGPNVEPAAIMAEDFRDLAPGESDSAERVFFPGLWGPKPPEALKPPCKVQIVFVFAWRSARQEGYHADGRKPTMFNGLWTGEARSKPVQIEVAK